MFGESLVFVVPFVLALGIFYLSVTGRTGSLLRITGVVTSVVACVLLVGAVCVLQTVYLRRTLMLTAMAFLSALVFFAQLGWFLAITPGPIYIHLSYAPRWRILDRIDRGLDPFEGMSRTIDPPPKGEVESESDDLLDEAVAEL